MDKGLDATPMDQLSGIPVVRSVRAVREMVRRWRRCGETVALVPTMGALHDGHLALVRGARQAADRVCVSIFVNPAQFAPHEDLATYPRDEAGDAARLAAIGCDLIYAPTAGEMYPPAFSTTVSVSGLTEGLCGAVRPHFFRGVATVVSKLLIQVGPDVAMFGEKDYQQLKVVERLSRDLDLGVRILPIQTVREPDGLAMSSRNAYLKGNERAVAPLLHATLQGAADEAAADQEHSAFRTIADGAVARLLAAGFDRVDYFELRAAEDLAPMERLDRPARLLAAAWLGRTRLIDNIPASVAIRG